MHKLEQARKLLGLIFDDGDWVTLHAIESWTQDGKKHSRVDYANVHTLRCRDLWSVLPVIADRAIQERCGVYFGVCPRFGTGGGYEEAWGIRKVPVLWSDIDDAQTDEALRRCADAGLPAPSAVISSGNGCHLYWILDEPLLIDDAGDPPQVNTEFIESKDGKRRPRKYILDCDERLYLDAPQNRPRLSEKAVYVQDILAGIADAIGGDHTTDLSRLLRAPGTMNRKNERNGADPKKCRIVALDAARRYEIDQFAPFVNRSPARVRRQKVTTRANMQIELDTFFEERLAVLKAKLTELDERIPGDALAKNDEHYGQLDEAFCEAVQACSHMDALIGEDEDQLKEVRDRFYAETDPWFSKSWFANHARSKPRGFPGDFEMLSVMYDGLVKGRGFGGYLDLRLLDLTLLHAVRTRMLAVREFLIEELSQRHGDIRILDVACGPCREYVGGLPHTGQCRVHLTCVDNDREALDFVETNVLPAAEGVSAFTCTRYNALRMTSAKANLRHFGRSDIIYSVGLADYIPDRHLIPMLCAWRESLNSGGILYVAFKDIERYDKTPYEWLLDWHFLSRTEEDCRRLLQQAGFDATQLEMNRDETGVIMNFMGRVQQSAAVRVDVVAQESIAERGAATTLHTRGGRPGKAEWTPKTREERPEPRGTTVQAAN